MVEIKIGDIAPEIVGPSVNLGEFKLSDLRGKGRVFLIFSRYFGCSLCQLDFRELVEKAGEIQKEGRIVFVTQSKEENVKKFLSDKSVPFPVVSDPTEPYPLYKAYGIGDFSPLDIPKVMARAAKARSLGLQHGAYEGNEKQSPADFIISREGTIEYAHYGPLDLDKALEVWHKK